MKTLEQAILERLEANRQLQEEERREEERKQAEVKQKEDLVAKLFRQQILEHYQLEDVPEIVVSLNEFNTECNIWVALGDSHEVHFNQGVRLQEDESRLEITETQEHDWMPMYDEETWIYCDDFIDAVIYAKYGTLTPDLTEPEPELF